MTADGHIHRYDVGVGELRIPAIFVQKRIMPNPKYNLPRIRDMEIYEDDVFICTVPKSGRSNLYYCYKTEHEHLFVNTMPA